MHSPEFPKCCKCVLRRIVQIKTDPRSCNHGILSIQVSDLSYPPHGDAVRWHSTGCSLSTSIRGGWNIHIWSNFLGGPGIFALGHVWTGEKNLFTIRLRLDPPQIHKKIGPTIKFYKGKSAKNGRKKWHFCGFGHNFLQDYRINLIPFVYFWNLAILLIDT
jgi:hypothetical protein